MDFAQLYDDYHGKVFRLALDLLKNEEDAVEAVQETFRRAYAARGSFEGRSGPSTWLYRIAYNHCVTELAKGRRRAELPEDLVSGEPGPHAQAEAAELGRRLESALSALQEDDRRLLALLADGELDYAAASEVLGLPVTAVRMRVSRARRRLKELMEEVKP